jgi:hypothetical protein
MQRLSTLTDDTLLESLHALVGSHQRVTADLIAHLSEVDARRLHADKGFSSLFAYCVERLGFSEDEACRRIDAARLARKFPEIYSLLERGSVSLTVLGLLKQHLTAENHRELLEAVSRSSVRQTKEWLAARFPQPDVASSIRKLPERSAASEPVVKSACAATIVTEGLLQPQPQPGGARSGTAPSVSAGPGLAAAPLAPARASIEPLSRDRFLVKFTASRALTEKLALACDLSRHANPTGDVAVVFERAVDLLVAQLEKTKQGRTKYPQNERPIRSGAPVRDAVPPPNQQAAAVCCEDVATTSRSNRAPITRATRREVVERAGWRCSFVADDGRRCDARAFVEFDHETPRSLGGSSQAENLRLLCRAHNRLAAERIYGKAYVSQAIVRARATREDYAR